MSYQPKVYFISTEYLRQNTPIEQNVDDNKILPFITKAEDTYLQEVIGETGYDNLKDNLIANTLTTDDIKHININNIHTVDKYTLKALKTLALYHNIQQSKKNGNKWKPLSKIELYNKIHDYLEQNNKVNL
jgi:hypothetical protein